MFNQALSILYSTFFAPCIFAKVFTFFVISCNKGANFKSVCKLKVLIVAYVLPVQWSDPEGTFFRKFKEWSYRSTTWLLSSKLTSLYIDTGNHVITSGIKLPQPIFLCFHPTPKKKSLGRSELGREWEAATDMLFRLMTN